MKKNKIDWEALKTDWRKQVNLLLLIIFLPAAIYLLAVRQFLTFLILAAVVYMLLKLVKKKEPIDQ